MEELIDTQPFMRSIITFLLTRPDEWWWLSARPSFTHSSYFSKVDTISLKSGRFEGFADQHRFIRRASAGWQLAGRGGLSFWSTIIQSVFKLNYLLMTALSLFIMHAYDLKSITRYTKISSSVRSSANPRVYF